MGWITIGFADLTVAATGGLAGVFYVSIFLAFEGGVLSGVALGLVL
ncbi:MAG: hypothetical protein ACJAR3_002591 [Roseivirga sp.]|jgi:hypothetical protein